MSDITYVLTPSTPQFQWFADQLRASRAVIALSLEHEKPLFNIRLAMLSQWSKGATDNLSSYVNNGMQGMSLITLSAPVWQMQFKYRAMGSGGIRQYPNGDIYLPPLRASGQLSVPDCPIDMAHPITSLIFRLDTDTPGKPFWSVIVHRNMRPPMPYIKRKPRVV